MVDQIAAPGGGNALSVVVNTVTNKVYVAVSGGTASGVYALDVATNTWTLIPTTTNPSTLLVNDAKNLVYAVTGTSLYVIDGATNTRLAVDYAAGQRIGRHHRHAARRAPAIGARLRPALRVPGHEPARRD